MSQKHPKTIIKIKSNPWEIRVKKFFFSKFADWRGKISEERFSWNSLGACFRQYAISLKVVARLKNLEVKIPYVKKYMTQNPEKPQLIDSMILIFFFKLYCSPYLFYCYCTIFMKEKRLKQCMCYILKLCRSH